MQILPMNQYLLIKPKKASNKSKGGIITDVNEDKQVEIGEVIEASGDVRSIAKGHEVLFKSFNTDELNIDGEKLVFIKFEDVLAIRR